MDTNCSATHAAYCTVAATGNIIAKPTSTSPRASASLPPVSSSTPTTSPEPGLSTNKQLQIASIPPVESISGFHFPPWPLLSPLSPVYVSLSLFLPPGSGSALGKQSRSARKQFKFV